MYAVVLSPQEFWGILGPSEADALKSGFPGLTVVPAADHGALEFEEPVKLHTLYMLLPKEQLYVKAEHYPDRCLHSEVHEMLCLFARLGFASIRMRGELPFRIGGAVETYKNVWDLYHFTEKTHFYHLERNPAWQQLVRRRMDGVVCDQHDCFSNPLPDWVLAAMKNLNLGHPPRSSEIKLGVVYK